MPSFTVIGSLKSRRTKEVGQNNQTADTCKGRDWSKLLPRKKAMKAFSTTRVGLLPRGVEVRVNILLLQAWFSWALQHNAGKYTHTYIKGLHRKKQIKVGPQQCLLLAPALPLWQTFFMATEAAMETVNPLVEDAAKELSARGEKRSKRSIFFSGQKRVVLFLLVVFLVTAVTVKAVFDFLGDASKKVEVSGAVVTVAFEGPVVVANGEFLCRALNEGLRRPRQGRGHGAFPLEANECLCAAGRLRRRVDALGETPRATRGDRGGTRIPANGRWRGAN